MRPEIPPEISGHGWPWPGTALQGWSQKADVFQRVQRVQRASLTPASYIAFESHAPETCVKTCQDYA